MKNFITLRKWLLIPLFALASVLIIGVLNSYTHMSQEVVYLTPVFQDDKGWDIYTMKNGNPTALTPKELQAVEPGETFYLSRTIPEDWESGGYSFLFLDGDRPSSVFLEDALLYSTCPNSGDGIGQVVFPKGYNGLSQRGEALRFTIPGGSGGKVLTIATSHPVSEYGASMPGILLSSEAIEAAMWMNTANTSAMPAAAFAVAALLLLGLLVYSLFLGSRNVSLLLLAATAFCYLFYYLRQYSFSAPGATPLDTPIAAFLPMLAVLLPELYLLLQMKRHRRLCAIFVLSAGALSLVPPVANLFGSPGFSTTPFVEALYIGLLAILVFAVLEAKDKNKAFRLFLYGLSGVCACIAAGCFISGVSNPFFANYIGSLMGQVVSHDPFLPLHWFGILLFLMAAAISVYQLIRSAADTQTALAVETERSARLDYALTVEKEIYEAKLSGEEELRALRHDVKGHLLTLSELLADHKTEEATLYLSGLTRQPQERQNEVFCGNSYMNAVLRSYSRRFQENHVAFDCQAGVDSQTLPGVELCLIMNNALENALEASIEQPEAQRSVKLQARIWHGQFLLRVSNQFTGVLQERGELPVTTKKEPGHGYGLANIRQTVQRLGGEMNYQIEEGCFVLDVRFPVL